MKIIRFICDNRFRLFKSFLAYLTFFCLGSACNLLGSSLLDLQIRLNVDFAKVSYLITLRSAGHILGSAFSGFIEQGFDRSLILSVCDLISGIFLGAAPNFKQFEYAGCFLFVAGLAHGIVDVLCHTLITDTWKDKCTNWLQALHMSAGIGSLFAPILCRPFLIPEEDEMSVQRAINETFVDPKFNQIGTLASDVKAQYAFMIIGSITAMTGLAFAYIYTKERGSRDNSIKQIDIDSKQKWPLWKVYGGIILVVIISHLVISLEAVLGTLGASFSVKSDLRMDKKTGVLLATVFWSCFTFYRLLFIPLTFVVSVVKLLLINILFTLLGVFICFIWGNTHQVFIWIGFTLLGMGLSPVFSCSYGMLAKNIVMTGKISTLIVIPGALGESAHPALAATLMATNPLSFLYYIMILGLLLISTFGLFLIYCKVVFKPPHGLHPEIKERLSSISHR